MNESLLVPLGLLPYKAGRTYSSPAEGRHIEAMVIILVCVCWLAVYYFIPDSLSG